MEVIKKFVNEVERDIQVSRLVINLMLMKVNMRFGIMEVVNS